MLELPPFKTNKRRPYSDRTLVLIFDHVKITICASAFETTLFQAAYTLAFFGLFRVGELVFSSDDQADRPLYNSDVSMNIEGTASLKVRVRKSKTNQGKSPDIVDIGPVASHFFPIRAMIKYLNVRPNVSQYCLPQKRITFNEVPVRGSPQ